MLSFCEGWKAESRRKEEFFVKKQGKNERHNVKDGKQKAQQVGYKVMKSCTGWIHDFLVKSYTLSTTPCITGTQPQSRVMDQVHNFGPQTCIESIISAHRRVLSPQLSVVLHREHDFATLFLTFVSRLPIFSLFFKNTLKKIPCYLYFIFFFFET